MLLRRWRGGRVLPHWWLNGPGSARILGTGRPPVVEGNASTSSASQRRCCWRLDAGRTGWCRACLCDTGDPLSGLLRASSNEMTSSLLIFRHTLVQACSRLSIKLRSRGQAWTRLDAMGLIRRKRASTISSRMLACILVVSSNYKRYTTMRRLQPWRDQALDEALDRALVTRLDI